MKSLSLIVCLILTIGYVNNVEAVSDAELEALEKQIEQLEAEEKKQAEAEAKRKVEQKRKAKAEAKRKAEAEAEKQANEKRKQEAEEKLFAEEETKRKEEEVKKRAEEEKKEKYKLLIVEAEQAMSNKDKELAISKYNGALELKPSDRIAIDGIKEAKKLKDKVCYEVFGNWVSKLGKVNVNGDGTFTWDNGAASGSGTWECSDPKARKFDFITPSGWISDWTSLLTEDGRCFSFWNEACWTRPDY